MNVVTFESLTLQERGHARGGVFRFYDLLHGRPGAPDNFYLSIGVLRGTLCRRAIAITSIRCASSSRGRMTSRPTGR
jgi:hypothetical protein